MLSVLFCGAMLVAGTDIDVNGKFAGSTEGEKEPAGWVFNPSVKPDGTGKVVKVGDKFGVQISNPKRALHYYSKKQVNVAPGEKYELSCDVTGTGYAGLAMYLYNAKGWVGGIYQKPVKLQPGENDLKFEIVIPAESSETYVISRKETESSDIVIPELGDIISMMPETISFDNIMISFYLPF